MASAAERIARMGEESKGERKPWRERLAEMVSTEDGWREFLAVMAEHPGMGMYNATWVTAARLAHGYTDTQELLTYERARELGGHVRRGAKGIALSVPSGDGFRTEVRFPASACEGLDEGRYQGRPRKVHPEVPESVDAFVEASGKVDLDGMTPAEDFAFSARYGLAEPGDPLPERPVADTPDVLVAQLADMSSRLSVVCRGLDRALAEQAHPELAQGQAAPTEAVAPEAPKPAQAQAPVATGVGAAAQEPTPAPAQAPTAPSATEVSQAAKRAAANGRPQGGRQPEMSHQTAPRG